MYKKLSDENIDELADVKEKLKSIFNNADLFGLAFKWEDSGDFNDAGLAIVDNGGDVIFQILFYKSTKGELRVGGTKYIDSDAVDKYKNEIKRIAKENGIEIK
jgi:hypothetical protein